MQGNHNKISQHVHNTIMSFTTVGTITKKKTPLGGDKVQDDPGTYFKYSGANRGS